MHLLGGKEEHNEREKKREKKRERRYRKALCGTVLDRLVGYGKHPCDRILNLEEVARTDPEPRNSLDWLWRNISKPKAVTTSSPGLIVHEH
ncbi:MAG: hypothetical protein AAB339_07390, partial [Elusimicrobiota bacterium]